MSDQCNDYRNDSHLPECIDYPIPDFNNGVWLCICPALRACEQRVRENERQKIRTSYLTGIQVVEVNKAYVSGYNRALDAAREAVAAECHHDDPNEWCIYVAAIDALRGYRYSDSHQPQVDGTEAHRG